MVRRLSSRGLIAVAAFAVLAGAGCHSDGTVQLSWTFAGDGDTSALTCAQRGVFSIWVTGASLDGDGDSEEVPCAPGVFTQSVHASTWSFTVLGLDQSGCYRGNRLLGTGDAGAGADATDGGAALSSSSVCRPTSDLGLLAARVAPIEIPKDKTTPIAVTLASLPTCSDGVDNNGDGRVDLDDPVCHGDPGASEGAAQ
ncbi:MAG TPA: hypothetical protein VMU50_14630 [Polyangia bacterium]|nr:hypothetical protein [Polyangia bacterium]